MLILGMDIGGSHASVAQIAWDGSTAEIKQFHEADVDSSLSVEELISAWVSMIHQTAGGEQVLRLGIAMPGPFDYPNGVSLIKDQGKMKALYGLSVRNLLAERLAIDPRHIAFTNDAEAFLLGESLSGAGRGFRNSIGLTLGTGLGSALKFGAEVKDAKLWTAPFRNGIAEDYLGTGWIKMYAAEKFGWEISGMKDLLSGGFDLEKVEEVMREFGTALGEFLVPFADQIQGVVLGGKIAKSSNRFLSYTMSVLEAHSRPLEIRIATLGESAAMIGACVPFVPLLRKS